MTTLRVTSFGSIWEIDEDLMRYRRYPRREQPRERAEWSDERAGALQDFVWHPMAGEWRLEPRHKRLIIPVPDERATFYGKQMIASAPLDDDEFERLSKERAL